MTSWTHHAHHAHHARRILGIALSGYEHAAFVIDDSGVIPKISDHCWPNEDGTTTENRVRLGLALFCSSWVCVHLLRPWVLRLFKGGRPMTPHPLS